MLKAESHACGINIFFPNQKQLVVETAYWAVKENQPLSPWEKRSFLFQGKRVSHNWRGSYLTAFKCTVKLFPFLLSHPSPSLSFVFWWISQKPVHFWGGFQKWWFQLSRVSLDCWCCLSLGFSQLWVSRALSMSLLPGLKARLLCGTFPVNQTLGVPHSLPTSSLSAWLFLTCSRSSVKFWLNGTNWASKCRSSELACSFRFLLTLYELI